MTYADLYTALKNRIVEALPEATGRVFLPHESEIWSSQGFLVATSSTPLVQLVDAIPISLSLRGFARSIMLPFDVIGNQVDVQSWVEILHSKLNSTGYQRTPYETVTSPTPESLPDQKLRVRFFLKTEIKQALSL